MAISYALMFCRVTVILVFALAVIGKAQDIPAFQEAIVDFRLLPPKWSKTAALVFLGLESTTILLIVVGGKMLTIGFLLAIILLMGFTVALMLVLRRKMRVRCNCFGKIEHYVSSYDIIRNMLFILCSLFGMWAASHASRTPVWDEFLLIGVMAICFSILGTNLSDVIETLRKPFRI